MYGGVRVPSRATPPHAEPLASPMVKQPSLNRINLSHLRRVRGTHICESLITLCAAPLNVRCSSNGERDLGRR